MEKQSNRAAIRELDLIIAEKIEGWQWPLKSGGEIYAVNPYSAKTTADPKGNLTAAHQFVPSYSQAIDLALRVVEKVLASNTSAIFYLYAASPKHLWSASLASGNDGEVCVVEGVSSPAEAAARALAGYIKGDWTKFKVESESLQKEKPKAKRGRKAVSQG
jgi:hypothetical protein